MSAFDDHHGDRCDHQCDDVVWGNALQEASVVKGVASADEDNIVWGTFAALDEDNIVWGTLATDEDNIVWGTSTALLGVR